MSKTTKCQPLSELELEEKLHQLVLPLGGLDKKSQEHYISNENGERMNVIQRAKDILRVIAEDIPALDAIKPASGDETVRRTSYLLNLAQLRDLLVLAETPTLVMKPIAPESGDLMTIEEFQENVNARNFTDYDGHGKWATETHITNIAIWPSLFRDWPFPPKTEPPITHVIWYNK